jgi:5-methyltetrahydrofolate--homocysteine methyltransferase
MGLHELAVHAAHAGIAAIGLNCGRGVQFRDMVRATPALRDASKLPVFVRPNAGQPVNEFGEWMYPVDPPSMAAELDALVAAGVSMVGGCCGTTPAHVAAMRTALRGSDECRE